MFDKRDLDIAIRDQLRPPLKKAGFSRFSGRNAWRIGTVAVDIVSVQLAREECDENFHIRPSRTFFAHLATLPRSAVVWKLNRRSQPTVEKLPRDYDCTMANRFGCSVGEQMPQFEVSVSGHNLDLLVKQLVEWVIIDGLRWFNQKHRMM